MSRTGFSEVQWLLTLRTAFYLYAPTACAYAMAGLISKIRTRAEPIPWIILVINPFLCVFFSVFIAWGLSGPDAEPAWIGGGFATLFVVLPALVTLGSAVFKSGDQKSGKKSFSPRTPPPVAKIFGGLFGAIFGYVIFKSWIAAVLGFVFFALFGGKGNSRSSGSSSSSSSGGGSSKSSSSGSSSSSGGGSSGGGGSSSSW